MGRPQNTEQRGAIQRAAWQLFLSEGYERTTYAAIADACGISRDLAHHYFPRKEQLAVALKRAVLDEAERAVCEANLPIRNEFQLMYAVGCVGFDFLMATAGSRRFLMDALADRELTEQAIAFNAEWALEQIRPVDGERGAKAERAVIMQLNGFAGLMYHCLRMDEPFNVEEEFREVMEAVARAAGSLAALDGFPQDASSFGAEAQALAARLGSAITQADG